MVDRSIRRARPGAGTATGPAIRADIAADSGTAAGQLDAVFRALADGTRRSMLLRLAEQPATVGELAAPFDISLAAASKHIQVLERAGLVQRTVFGRTHVCALQAEPLHAGMEWIRHYEQFWDRRLDALEALLSADAAAPAEPHPPRRDP